MSGLLILLVVPLHGVAGSTEFSGIGIGKEPVDSTKNQHAGNEDHQENDKPLEGKPTGATRPFGRRHKLYYP